MTKRQHSASPISSRKRRASSNSYSEASDPQSGTSSGSHNKPGLLASLSSSVRSLSPTQGSPTHTNTSKRLPSDPLDVEPSSPPPSAPHPIPNLKTNAIDDTGGMIAPTLKASMGAVEPLTPETREPSHDSTVILRYPKSSVEPTAMNALVQFQAPDVFPVFRSGDVIIHTDLGSTPTTFQFHRAVLARQSPWFQNAFQVSDVEDLHPTWFSFRIEDRDGKIRLVQQQVQGDRPAIIPVTQEPIVKTEDMSDDLIAVGTRGASSEVEGAAVVVQSPPNPAAVALYSQIFGAFYNIPLSVSTTDIGAALVQSEELVKIAGDLGCVHLIRPYLGNVFGQYRQKLFAAIKTDPPRWILLAMTLEHASIYTESFIHLVGAHPTWPWLTKRTVLHPELRQLIAKKSEVLDQKCIEAERELLAATIKINKIPVQPQDRSHIETWMVVQVFRDALARHLLTMESNSNKKSKHQGTFFRKIYTGSYMEYEEVRSMCDDIIKSHWKDLGDDLKTLKAYAMVVVAELAENELMIDPDSQNVGYLTCVKIQPQDFPWQTEGQSAFWQPQ